MVAGHRRASAQGLAVARVRGTEIVIGIVTPVDAHEVGWIDSIKRRFVNGSPADPV